MKNAGRQASAALLIGVLLATVNALVAGACAPAPPTPIERLDVEIRRTSIGVPHVLAKNYVALSYGLGYAYAQDSACEIAQHWVRLNGELSQFFGPDDGNLESDLFWQRIKDDDIIGQEFAKAVLSSPSQLRPASSSASSSTESCVKAVPLT